MNPHHHHRRTPMAHALLSLVTVTPTDKDGLPLVDATLHASTYAS